MNITRLVANRRIKAASVGCTMFSSADGDGESERSPLLLPRHPGNRDKTTLGNIQQCLSVSQAADTVGFTGQIR